jgi:hypothetical protein
VALFKKSYLLFHLFIEAHMSGGEKLCLLRAKEKKDTLYPEITVS